VLTDSLFAIQLDVHALKVTLCDVLSFVNLPFYYRIGIDYYAVFFEVVDQQVGMIVNCFKYHIFQYCVSTFLKSSFTCYYIMIVV